MGVNSDYLRFMCGSVKGGAKLGRTLTLGRQQYFDHAACRDVLREYGYRADDSEPLPVYADEVFHAMGVDSLDSIDYSAYEHATIIHDMNQPVPPEMDNTYDFIYDGGTLEHVFNIPVALNNCQRLVKPGGYILLTLVTNNYMGHGFYQFSPEFLYANFNKASGFEVLSAVLLEESRPSRWHTLRDPGNVGTRVCLINSYPSIILALVRKNKSTPFDMKSPPLQSDYVSVWQNEETAYDHAGGLRKQARKLQDLLPNGLKYWLIRMYRRHYVETTRNRAFYQPVKKKGFVIPC